ncbi:helix-turn-helix domain-containing protein [Nocardiopsis changdeensis]|uniref:Helix-turn-helix transcriptional regulator n=1 Tax=Nocardiopsis changdeensis TaxID=2831969 RepID=A0ABX8BLB2_9ACTN|nr:MULTISPECIES: helix-turn-helix transcriptional regulator [Nocardiopsis]QUX23012.1 helix-turn-helix transcriptional regulator [Nocardiopsis changdeensis]QYX38957.1 helix-turn-helix domain-containing protein [Nocardiopsis sp. MT53]
MTSPRTHHDEGAENLVFDRVAFRKARTRAGLSLARLAREIGRSESGLKKLQSGHRTRPHPDTYLRIIGRLGLSFGDLWLDTPQAPHHEHPMGSEAA